MKAAPPPIRAAAILAAAAACLAAAGAVAQAVRVPPPRPADLARPPAGNGEAAGGETDDAAEAEPAVPTPDRPYALLRGLDKFSGVAATFAAPIGEPVAYGRLTVTVRACRPDQDETAIAYLVITDARDPDAPVFAGWMFAESPALSALDHPRYDVWVAKCSTASGEAD